VKTEVEEIQVAETKRRRGKRESRKEVRRKGKEEGENDRCKKSSREIGTRRKK